MDLKVSFLKKADPELALIGIGTNQIAKLIHWQKIVYFYGSPNTVDKEFDNVLSARIINRVTQLILRIDLTRNYSLLVFHLEFIMGCHCKRRKH
jgi:hypothetical protein